MGHKGDDGGGFGRRGVRGFGLRRWTGRRESRVPAGREALRTQPQHNEEISHDSTRDTKTQNYYIQCTLCSSTSSSRRFEIQSPGGISTQAQTAKQTLAATSARGQRAARRVRVVVVSRVSAIMLLGCCCAVLVFDCNARLLLASTFTLGGVFFLFDRRMFYESCNHGVARLLSRMAQTYRAERDGRTGRTEQNADRPNVGGCG